MKQEDQNKRNAITAKEHFALLEYLVSETSRTVLPEDKTAGWSNVSMERIERIHKTAKNLLDRQKRLIAADLHGVA